MKFCNDPFLQRSIDFFNPLLMNSFHLAYNSSDSLRFSIYNFLSPSLITYSTHIQTNLSASIASKILNDGAISQLIFALKPLSSDLSLIFYLLLRRLSYTFESVEPKRAPEVLLQSYLCTLEVG
ncbi:unnamed protein product [Brassica rapa subsp. trilocularis]